MKSIVALALFGLSLAAYAEETPDKKLAIEYLMASQFEQVIDASIDAYADQVFKDLPKENRETFEKIMRETMGWEAIKDQLADLVTTTYSKEELEAYIAFVKTRRGASYTAKSTAFSDKFSVLLANNMQRFIQQNIPPVPQGSGPQEGRM